MHLASLLCGYELALYQTLLLYIYIPLDHRPHGDGR